MKNLPARRRTSQPRERSPYVTVRVTHTLRIDRAAYEQAYGMDSNADIQQDVRISVLNHLTAAPEAMQGLWEVVN